MTWDDAEVRRLIDMAGDWIETDPSLRSTACIEVALDHAKAIEADRDELRQRVAELEQVPGDNVCQRCNERGGRVVTFKRGSLLESRWICPNCIDAAEARVAELEREKAQAQNEAEENKVEWYAAVKSMREALGRAEAAEAKVQRLEGLIATWLSTNQTEAYAAGLGLVAEARRIREREARNA